MTLSSDPAAQYAVHAHLHMLVQISTIWHMHEAMQECVVLHAVWVALQQTGCFARHFHALGLGNDLHTLQLYARRLFNCVLHQPSAAHDQGQPGQALQGSDRGPGLPCSYREQLHIPECPYVGQ